MSVTTGRLGTDVLGEPYESEVIELPDDDEGRVVATLVRRRAPGGGHGGGRGGVQGAVLHLHGFCDYFFQTAMADFYVGLGLDFYALDLRKYGRSLLPHQTPNFCRDLSDYDAEIDAAVRRVRERDGHTTLVLSGHSTGGLVGALWADSRRAAGGPAVDAMVLNSPWLDLQGSLLMRTLGTRAIDELGRRRPYQVIPRNVSTLYGESLHSDFRGEYSYDLRWKPRESFPVRAGWLRAVRRGHRRLHRGLDVGAPALVLCSSRSSAPQEWCDDVTCSDVVLDVRQIARWAHALGPHVTVARVDRAIHDVLASPAEVRKEAYAEVQRWLAVYLGG
jgi:alpha-beta hydrolase superfamily lysophospholipase